MQGLMMDVPLMISSLIRHADRYHGDTEIVSRTVEGPIHRYTYRDAHVRARQLARALSRLGVAPGDRVGTLAWNGYRHFELYYAISGMGAITHTINPRLFHEQLAYIIGDAEDAIVFFDLTFTALVEKLAATCTRVKHWVAMTDRSHLPQAAIPGLSCYEDLLAAESDDFEWPEFDENTAASLCYTSGTTGKPKGVLFSHRSTILHAFAISLPDTKNLSASSAVLAIVPMFHVNAWGRELPRDGKSAGNLLVRGPWILRRYYKDAGGDPLTPDGWLPTGDVGTIDSDGYLQITDRSKDVISK